MDIAVLIGLIAVFFFFYVYVYQRKYAEAFASTSNEPTEAQKEAQKKARDETKKAREADDAQYMRRYKEIEQESLRQQATGVTPSTAKQFATSLGENGLGVVYEESPEGPYAKTPINDIDDYEIPNIYQTTTNREMNTATLNKLTAQYPLDWAGLPPNSDRFQFKRQDFVDGIYNAPVPDDSVFKAMEGGNLQPPDMDRIEAEEKKVLATYAPKQSPDMTTYSLEDAHDLIKKIYKKKGLIPEIKEDPNNANVYQVVGTQEINPKIVWEDQAPATFDAVSQAGENTLRVPAAAVEQGSADPFFNTDRSSTRVGRNDYRQWTPGLERAFAPTYAKSSWY
jgi:hypothetical protein